MQYIMVKNGRGMPYAENRAICKHRPLDSYVVPSRDVPARKMKGVCRIIVRMTTPCARSGAFRYIADRVTGSKKNKRGVKKIYTLYFAVLSTHAETALIRPAFFAFPSYDNLP